MGSLVAGEEGPRLMSLRELLYGAGCPRWDPWAGPSTCVHGNS